MMKKKYVAIIAAMLLFAVAGAFIYKIIHVDIHIEEHVNDMSIIAGADGPTSIFLAGKSGGSSSADYITISMEEAKEAFEQDASYVILDVRRLDEYTEGHIPGAINIANEDIVDEDPVGLPDKEQLIYVYCRSGRRSKEAAAKLAALGYTNVIECGGILNWTGDLEK